MFGKLWPNHRTDSTTTKINDLFHSLPDQHLFRSSLVPYQNSNQFYLNYIFFHSIVKNANLCLEPNGFISYLLKKRMNKNTLLQGTEDYQGFNDYWILHLPKHILQLRAEAFGNNKDVHLHEGTQPVTAASATTPETLLLRMGPALGVWKERQAQLLMQSILRTMMVASISRQPSSMQKNLSGPSIPLVYDDVPSRG